MKTKGANLAIFAWQERRRPWQNLQRGAAAPEARKQSLMKKTGWISAHTTIIIHQKISG